MDTQMPMNMAYSATEVYSTINISTTYNRNAEAQSGNAMLSVHKTPFNLLARPNDGRSYISVMFCRPAQQDLEDVPVQFRSGVTRVVEIRNQNGRKVSAVQWSRDRSFSSPTTSWFDWILVGSLPSDRWIMPENKIAVIPDLWEDVCRESEYPEVEMVESGSQQVTPFSSDIPTSSIDQVMDVEMGEETNVEAGMWADMDVEMESGMDIDMELERSFKSMKFW